VKTVAGLTNSTMYYWRVNAKNIAGTSAWSTIYAFYTTVLVAPVLGTPANASSVTTRTPTLTWGTIIGAATYRVQVSTVSTFVTTVVNDSTLTTGSKILTTSLNNGTCYWRVNAKNAGGISVWSNTFTFTVSVTGIVPAVSHYSPGTLGHNGVLELYQPNGARVLLMTYEATATRTQLLNTALRTLAKGCYTYRFRSNDAITEIVGKLIK
jgi:hypothetical protein